MKHNYLKNVSTLELDTDKCKGCGNCIDVCPHNVFIMKSGKSEIQDKDHCIECGACMKNCPFAAIKVEAGVGCASAIIRGILTGSKPTCDPKDSKGKKKSCC